MTLGDGNSHERLAIQIEGHIRFMCHLLIGNDLGRSYVEASSKAPVP